MGRKVFLFFLSKSQGRAVFAYGSIFVDCSYRSHWVGGAEAGKKKKKNKTAK